MRPAQWSQSAAAAAADEVCVNSLRSDGKSSDVYVWRTRTRWLIRVYLVFNPACWRTSRQSASLQGFEASWWCGSFRKPSRVKWHQTLKTRTRPDQHRAASSLLFSSQNTATCRLQFHFHHGPHLMFRGVSFGPGHSWCRTEQDVHFFYLQDTQSETLWWAGLFSGSSLQSGPPSVRRSL